ncbi:ABC transporter substrate-binding protein [Rhodococcus opacus]|uniref:ABC transporter substrate-binding protein n=1 Tax=Rhodococcus opacus TaxID=37919 RepID=UPI001C43A8D7|nr:sugar ABC transporter substrate-binding protein [Rhodococcus opacus]MBV6760206.1 sugar ABC transporter substrate-binding protein [Rhodococcus opacus]
MRRTFLAAGICCAATTLTLSGCAGAGSLGSSGDTVTIAMVSNPQMQDAIKLSEQFEAENPGIDLKFVTLPENEARAKITASTATGGGEFDVTMISNYETPQWAENGWLTNLEPYIAQTEGYDQDDFIPSIKDALSYQGDMYSVPFYGESSFLMYRKDLFEQAGITVPDNPTWEQVAGWAEQFDNPDNDMTGICLRGKPGWGEVLAPLDTVINTFGGRWFDENWNAQLDSPEVKEAVQFYVDLVREHGEPGPATSGFSECATQFAQGHAAMWYDATSAVNTVESAESSQVVGKVGYAKAPMKVKENPGWLYTWSLGIPESSDQKDAAWKFVSWMTNKQYIDKVGNDLGWERVPPGSRNSTYQIPQYDEISGAYGPITLASINNADSQHPTVQPVPYTGVQFLTIPEFQDLGTRVSQQISAAIAGRTSVDDALAQAQQYAEVVGKTYQEEGR